VPAAGDTLPALDVSPDTALDAVLPVDQGPVGTCGIGGASWAKPWTANEILKGFAAAPDGTLWGAGNLGEAYDFVGSGTPVSHPSGTKPEVFVIKMNPSTGGVTEAFGFGYTEGSLPQSASGNTVVAVAPTVSGGSTVGIIGSFQGEIDFDQFNQDGSGNPGGTAGTAGVDYLFASSTFSFYAVLNGNSSGTYATPIRAHMIDLGSGALLAIASNPTQNAFAICGKTNKGVAKYFNNGTSSGLITPSAATFGGGNSDLVVAKIDAGTGAVIWGKQYGGAGDQVCESVALDNSGNVLIAGNYSGSLFSLPDVSDTTGATAQLFLAQLAAADGSLQWASSFAGTTSFRSDAYGLTVDANGNIVMGGSLGSSVDFGNGHVATWTGLTDAFAVKFNAPQGPPLVAPNSLWVYSDGDPNGANPYDQTVETVAVSSAGDVFVGGSFRGALPALGLTDSSNATTDAFMAQLSGANGSVLCAHAYGDARGDQSITTISVARVATGALADSIFVGGVFYSSITLGSKTLAFDPGTVACTTSGGECQLGETCSNGFCAIAGEGPSETFISRLVPSP
jgi:hypothetical protein